MRQEQHFYRDEELLVRMTSWDGDFSVRHRMWGRELFATDTDHVVTDCPFRVSDGVLFKENYNFRPWAFVEYKHINAWFLGWRKKYEYQWRPDRWTANKCELPYFYNFYDREGWNMVVYPMNAYAEEWIGSKPVLFEEWEWVKLLYEVRYLIVSKEHLDRFRKGNPIARTAA